MTALSRLFLPLRHLFAATLLLALCVPADGANAQLSVATARCQTDDEVPARDRSVYEEPALSLVQEVLAGAAEKAYARFSNDAKAIVKLEGIAQLGRQIAENGLLRPDAVRVAHSYRVTMSSTGSADQLLRCTAIARGSIARPEGWVAVRAKPVPLQAHVIVEGRAQNNLWNFAVWLIPERAQWQVQHVQATLATISDKSAQDFWTLAREESKRGRRFNAFILFGTAVQLAYRGPAFQLGIQPEIQKELAALQAPTTLQGKPPFIWKSQGKEFRVLSLGPIGFTDSFALRVRQQLATWGNNEYLERENRALLDVLRASHPEIANVFDHVVIEAVPGVGADLPAFRTVEELRKSGSRN
jgi:hypothetical protein